MVVIFNILGWRPVLINTISPLQDPVTWYGINYAGMEITQWDFQNKGTLTSPVHVICIVTFFFNKIASQGKMFLSGIKVIKLGILCNV